MSNEKPSSIAKYGSFDLAVMEGVEAQLPVGGGGDSFKPQEGKNVVRFLPPLPGKAPIKVWYKHHFAIGNQKRAIVCVKSQYNQPCPVCAEGHKLRSSASKRDQAQASGYEPSASAYANIVDMQNPEKGAQTWKISPGLFKKIRQNIDLLDLGDSFADPMKGHNIVFVRTGQGLQTRYDPVTVSQKPSPLPNADEIIMAQPDLESIEQAPTDEEQDAAVNGEYEVKERNSGGGRYDRAKSAGSGRSAGAAKAAPDDADVDF